MASVSSTGLGAMAGTEASPSLVSDGALTLEMGRSGLKAAGIAWTKVCAGEGCDVVAGCIE